MSGETRQRILDVALDLFVEQGYEKTSLREIAERVGVTKAALYYHFQSKEDIVTTLHMPVHELMHSAMARLGDTAGTASWLAFLDWLIDQLAAHSRLFLMYQRNAQAMGEMHRKDHGGPEVEPEQLFLAEARRPGAQPRRAGPDGRLAGRGRLRRGPGDAAGQPGSRIRPSSPPASGAAVRDLLRVDQPSA